METQKKKFLYMDKFIKHQEEDKTWKDSTVKAFKGLKDKVDGLVWIILISSCIAMAALLLTVFSK